MKTRFFALAALALALAACNNDNEILNNDGPVAARFIADIAPATRASGTTWDNGDRIGVTDIYGGKNEMRIYYKDVDSFKCLSERCLREFEES